MRPPARHEILGGPRHQERHVDGRARGRGRKGHDRPVLRRRREVVQARDAPDRALQRRVLGDITHALAMHVHRAIIPEARDVLRPRPHHICPLVRVSLERALVIVRPPHPALSPATGERDTCRCEFSSLDPSPHWGRGQGEGAMPSRVSQPSPRGMRAGHRHCAGDLWPGPRARCTRSPSRRRGRPSEGPAPRSAPPSRPSRPGGGSRG